jgi:hypothetical protein
MNIKSFPPYHPSQEVTDGKLRGLTDYAGHFHFLCPRCADNQILQILDFGLERDGPAEYAKKDRPLARRDFKIAFKVHCPECGLTDFVEVANDGIQGSKTHQLPNFFQGAALYKTSS